MISLSSVSWGPTDALTRDKQFSEKWVEPDEIKTCLHADNWIISGEKGAGKSAIRKALTEIYGDRYFVSAVVDFNDISFKVLYDNLVQLASTTRLSKTSTLSHYWQYSMVIELLAACAAKKPDVYGNLLDLIPPERSRVPLNERLMKLLEDAWNTIDTFTSGPKHRTRKNSGTRANMLASSGLTARLLQHLAEFPLDKDFVALKKDFFARIEQHQHRLVLILDGFDRLRNDGTRSDATRLIFASLIDAVQSIHADSALPPGLEIKAFIPHDRYLSLPLRDSDKVDTMHVSIRWTRETLQSFVKRRLEITTKLSFSSFQLAWRQVLPEHVTNSEYGLEEDSFEYIVRHTMLRPRQMQISLEHLGTEYHGRTIEPSMIPTAIAESCKKHAKYFVDEFRTDHPKLGRFVTSLQRRDNVMEFKQFRRLIEDSRNKGVLGEDTTTIEEEVDTLYAMGFFGNVVFLEAGRSVPPAYCPPTRESRRHYVDFFYKNPHPSISGALQDDSIVALHPVFVDYCNLRPHGSLIVG